MLGAPETVLPLCDGGRGRFASALRGGRRDGLRGVSSPKRPGLPDRRRPPRRLAATRARHLGDELRPEVREAFATMENLGIEPKIISGDNPRTVPRSSAQLGIPLRVA